MTKMGRGARLSYGPGFKAPRTLVHCEQYILGCTGGTGVTACSRKLAKQQEPGNG